MSHTRSSFLRALWLAVVTTPIFAQGVSFGLIGGLELNSDFQYRAGGTSAFTVDNVSTTQRIAFDRSHLVSKFGVKLEYDFTPRWSLDVGILIHRPTFTTTYAFDPPLRQFPDGPLISRTVTRYNEGVWEVPVLAKRRFMAGRRTLMLEGGPSFRPFGGMDGPGRFGVTGGIGTQWRAGRVRLEPSLRYTRWTDVRQSYTPAPFRRDEVALLLAVDTSGATLRGASGREPLSAGFIGGITLTKAFPAKEGWEGLTSRLAGVALDYRFSDRWSAEADVLYHPLILSERARATVVTWEIPMMAKYRFGSRASRPLLTGGPTYRPSGNRNGTNPSTFGFTAGVGWEISSGRLRLEPTLRYVRWQTDSPVEYAPASTRRDQLQAMLSIRYGSK